MDIHLTVAPLTTAGHEVVSADVSPTVVDDAEPILLTRCGICGYCLGVRAVEDPAAMSLVECPDCGTLNRIG